jgi:succinoglycan biosynthesis protein ExoU
MSINRGPAAARNHALEGIVSEYVCVLDADDWLQDGRFGRMFSRVPMHWDLLADDLLLASEAAPSLPRSQLLGIGEGEQREVNVVDFVAANISDSRRPRRELGYLKPLMRRGFLESMRLRYDDRLRLGEDFVLYVQALLRGAKLVLVPSCGYVAVARSGSLSRAHGALELAALEAADGRLLEEARFYCPNAVPILTAHRRSLRHKLEHRRMLDAKQSGDWPAAARAFLKTPSGAAHILTQTLRSKLSGL